jgi:two-component system, response regulator PdtaR
MARTVARHCASSLGCRALFLPDRLLFSKTRIDVGNTRAKNMGNPVVLIVESEALIRMSAVHMVEDAGFAPVEAWNSDEAIRILESRSDVRAVFTDINMSGSMDGLKLAHAIRLRWPPTHLIVTSGLNAKDKLPLNGLFISKPYSAEDVTAALNELFGSNPPSDRLLNVAGGKCVKVA